MSTGKTEALIPLKKIDTTMAMLKKNGGLSGAVGNIVFVNSGERTLVRSKPDGVKQSERTKAAASVFGIVSAREKWLPGEITYGLGFPALEFFAARHPARLRRTVTIDADSMISGKTNFGTPEALAGFDFNPKLEWSKCINFYPGFICGPGEKIFYCR